MIQYNPYERYNQAVTETLHDTAALDRALENTPPGARATFVVATDFIHTAVINRHGNELPARFNTDEVAHGLRVIGKFTHYALKRLSKEGLASQAAQTVLLRPGSFDNTLAPLAEEVTEVASRVEREYGLWGESDNLYPEELYTLAADGSLDFPCVPLHLYEVRHRLITEEGYQLREHGICGAHKTGVLKALYGSVVPTLVEHPQLGGVIIEPRNMAIGLSTI